MGKNDDRWTVKLRQDQVDILQLLFEHAIAGLHAGSANDDYAGLGRRISIQAVKEISDHIADITG